MEVRAIDYIARDFTAPLSLRWY